MSMLAELSFQDLSHTHPMSSHTVESVKIHISVPYLSHSSNNRRLCVSGKSREQSYYW